MICKSALMLALALGAVLRPAPGFAQNDSEDKTLDRAGRIATQPVRDVGIAKDKIPPVLAAAVEQPYAALRRCRDLVDELGRLNEALGPDFDSPPAKGDDKATLIAEAGGEMLVNSLIPFRGLVREVTGAAGAERRKIAALNAGIARRGFLRGLAQARNCRMPVRPAPAK